MKIYGVVVLMNDPNKDVIEYVPMDGSMTEFRRIDQTPADIQRAMSQLADANDATPLGILIDLADGEGG